MVNSRPIRVSTDFSILMTDISKRSGLSVPGVTKIVAVQLRTNQVEFVINNKKVRIKQNGGLGLVDLL